MTVKYAQLFKEIGGNIRRPEMAKVYDDFGFLTGVIPNAAKAYVSANELSIGGVLKKTVLTCTALPISFADDADVAQYGGKEIYNFPQGLLLTLGCVIDGALTLPSPFIDAFTGVTALGTVTATTGATLISTEADILQSTALTTAVAKVAVADAVTIAAALTESGARHLDGTTTAKNMFLNYAIADDALHTAAVGAFTGTISFAWMILGDK